MSKLAAVVRRGAEAIASRSRTRRARPTRFRIGTHNLHDQAGQVALFADVLLLTEAIPAKVRARAGDAWQVVVCDQQTDLVVVLRRRLFDVESVPDYRLAHHGDAGVTPHRGVFVVKVRIRATGQRVAFLVEHRINSWWKDERGEQDQRAALWHHHTDDVTLPWVAELEADGWVVFAGGDLNTPPNVQGYDGVLREVGSALDRLACSKVADLDRFRRGPLRKSDHHEISARATVPAPEKKAA